VTQHQRTRSDEDSLVWRKLITYVTALDYNFRFIFSPTTHELIFQLATVRDNPGVGLATYSDVDTRFRYQMAVSHRLNGFLQGAIGLRNHVSNVIDTFREELSVRDEGAVDRLGDAYQNHARTGPVALVYALSNVFRHELIPNTINLGIDATGPQAEEQHFRILTTLGFGGLVGGEGWTIEAVTYGETHNPVDLFMLAQEYKARVSQLVVTVNNEVRGEYMRRQPNVA
jgi:hypothetical protein